MSAKGRTALALLWNVHLAVLLMFDPDQRSRGQWNKHLYCGRLITLFTDAPLTPTTPPQLEKYGFEVGESATVAQAKAQESIPYITSVLDPEVKKNMSFTLHEVVINCVFNGISCEMEKDWYTLQDSKYGACYTFNNNRPVKYYSSRAGPLYGLRLILYSNQSEYMPTTETAGARVVIHDHGRYPFPDSYGYNAPHQNGRINYGNTECMARGHEQLYYFEGEYTTEGCQRTCYQKAAIAECGCGDPRFPLSSDRLSSYCTLENTVAKDCLNNFAAAKGPTLVCHCYPPCNETTFEVTISSSNWVYDDAQACIANPSTNSTECTEAKQSALLVEVFYENLNIQLIWETPAYSIYNLISDVAGQVGFWIGMSVIGMIEILAFLTTLCTHSCRLTHTKWQQRQAPVIPDVPTPYTTLTPRTSHHSTSSSTATNLSEQTTARAIFVSHLSAALSKATILPRRAWK